MAIKDLYEELGAIEYLLVESFGEITPEIEERTQAIQADVTKVVSWAIPKIREYEGMAKSKRAYAKEVTDSARFYENKTLGIKKLIDNLMVASELTKVETVEGKVSYRKSFPVSIDDESLIPKKYFIITKEVALDKKSLGKDLKKKDIAGAHIEEKQNIQIGG